MYKQLMHFINKPFGLRWNSKPMTVLAIDILRRNTRLPAEACATSFMTELRHTSNKFNNDRDNPILINRSNAIYTGLTTESVEFFQGPFILQ